MSTPANDAHPNGLSRIARSENMVGLLKLAALIMAPVVIGAISWMVVTLLDVKSITEIHTIQIAEAQRSRLASFAEIVDASTANQTSTLATLDRALAELLLRSQDNAHAIERIEDRLNAAGISKNAH